jgi:hypothetical protein
LSALRIVHRGVAASPLSSRRNVDSPAPFATGECGCAGP